ncbi:MAG: DUF1329 domain-containing protein [Hydrogenophaga sp.]|jgi:hypothetical protein|uniref:DUF1329 domain-containing protein n=1 Tax=Hydrogenophaga sp. TaxID=1904254 RepID=UPI00272901BE|nr:DUF1329 domain-containing protein [Hydrogenophaga sp.]MDO9249963.1 DUF1329 domain-containing protein [Hydrogenophaga sp.]MDP3345615.1 DUF1329 domain-containing protein [Hydrogenophaga sp.]
MTHNAKHPWLLAALLAASLPALAAVTAEEAARLKSTLTPVGAEKAGNKAGTIPAWDGGLSKAPAAYRNGDTRPDPFAADKPLLSISAKNMAEHADKLTDGVQALMKKHPDFHIDVYPTRRSAAAPQFVYDNTFQNATRAKTVDGGHGVEGAYGGIPFPIPKDGYEAIWNHRLAWRGGNFTMPVRVWVVTADGKRSMASGGVQTVNQTYYDKNGSLDKFDGFYQFGKFVVNAPGSKAGEAILAHDGVNASAPRGLWQYLVGQRRVRKAPSVAYDTPDSVTSGIGLFDEAFNLFGPIDKHDLKLVGKKEIYIPYNNNRAAAAKVEDLVTPGTLNPAQVRWELHRVWEVEATLAAGKRHVVPKRKYYIDEDSWQIVLFDGWDAKGQLWRTNYSLMLTAPDIPAVTSFVLWGGYDMQTGAYYLNMASNELPRQYEVKEPIQRAFFSPEALASEGGR